MALPVNIDELINARTVESERIEFKKGWNPKKVIHSICAFANDINNWSGGYIIIGVDEKDGQPILPPEGINNNQVDAIQKELLQYGKNKISPSYHPLVESVEFKGKTILIIYVPAGQQRPYEAASDLGKGVNKQMYVRRMSNTVVASNAEKQELRELATRIPFVDRLNHKVPLTAINRQLIVDYLTQIKSSLVEEAKTMNLEELCLVMNIAGGPEEKLVPKNIGLLFFSDKPGDYFYKAQIDVVLLGDNVPYDTFEEKIFEGPLHIQLKKAMDFIKDKVIIERVEKIPGQAEALRYYNFPYPAIEEALANAVYHKSYQSNEPIEVRIYKNEISIISFPGPVPPLSKESFKEDVLRVRQYRNGRVGDFLKELHLTERRGTGVPKIKRALLNNGSPEAIFNIDDERTFFETTILIQPSFSEKEDSEIKERYGMNDLFSSISEQDIIVLKFCFEPKSKKEVLDKIGLSNRTERFNTHIQPLVNKGLINLTIPDKPTSPNQKYIITDVGSYVLKIISE